MDKNAGLRGIAQEQARPKMARGDWCGGLGCGLATYWVLECAWFALFVGSMFAVETATWGAEGEALQTALALNFAHMLMWPAVFYMMDSKTKAKPMAAIFFLGVIATDTQSTLHAALHLWQTETYYWAFILDMTVASFALFISIYALIWYFVQLYTQLGAASENKYDHDY